MIYDTLIIGGGIIGLATAWQLQQRQPRNRILLIEKESQLASHQSSHNSGVIHAGFYYHPQSLKARFCREGAAALKNFCGKHGIPYQQTGKLLVATNSEEYQRMQALYDRCLENQVTVKCLNDEALQEREPNIAGLGALFVPDTGMVSYPKVCQQMAHIFIKNGGEIILNCEVISILENASQVRLSTTKGDYLGKQLITCVGLMADRMVFATGIKPDFQILPFRGEYYRLPSSKSDLINHQIYPIPDPQLPFLGVHLTRTIDGNITVGPNAILSLKREGYKKSSIDYQDMLAMLGFSGFWHLLAKNIRPGLNELKNTLYKTGYLKLVQKYCPQLQLDDLLPHPAGVRAQAVLKDGTLVHDFLFRQTKRSLHVCNAPSPAATSSIPIGAYICEKVLS